MARMAMDGAAASSGIAGAGPVPVRDRAPLIDIIRGFALFGVMLANMVWTTQWQALSHEQREALPTSEIDHWAGLMVEWLVTYKFYTLFSILFGLGFAMQLERARVADRSMVPLYLRRLAVLLAFGVAHALLLWFGDILHIYALLGLGLILFRNVGDRALLVWIAGLALAASLFPFLGWLTSAPEAAGGEGEGGAWTEGAYFAALSGGSWVDVVRANWAFNRDDYLGTVVEAGSIAHWYLGVFWKFLLGLAIGRRLLLREPERHRAVFRRVLPWALVVGLVGNGYAALGQGLGLGLDGDSALSVTWPVVEVGVLALSAAYACGLALLYLGERSRGWVGVLAPVGRMALTNYLMQSVLLAAVFYGVGLGLLGKVGTTGCIGISVVLFGGQIAASGWWLRRFRFGPAEWAWRSLTHWRMQPMRVAREA